MLLLIGLGLDTKDLSVRALEELKNADEILLETYTSFIPKSYTSFLQKHAGKKLVFISRQALEDNVKAMVAKAKKAKVAILFPGDPLVATTHSIILDEANSQGIKFKIFHAPSIFSAAIGESGLDFYRFGPTVTIPFWFEKYKPTSFLDAINTNLKNHQHTLLLLDIDQTNKRPMKIEEALEIVKKAQLKNGKSAVQIISILILANVGRKDQKIKYLRVSDVDTKLIKELNGSVLSIIIPSHMSFAEKESLKRIKLNP